MNDSNEVAGIFDAISTEVTAHDPVQEPVTEPVAEGAESTTDEEAVNTKTENVEEPEQSPETTTEPTTITQEPSKSTDGANTETQTTDAEIENWKQTLPPAPADYTGKIPEIDPETGQVVNMNFDEYQFYTKEVTKAEIRKEMYAQMIETRALDVAEKILPEMKTNKLVTQLVQNARVASIINGQEIDTVEAAKQVREALGLSPERLQQARAEGANNAKASITIQKNAALETGSAQTQPDTSKVDNLTKRIKRGDDEAFVELLNIWGESGKL